MQGLIKSLNGGYDWALFILKRGIRMKIKDKGNGCKGCIWLDREGLCPFLRCVKKNGWAADKRGEQNAHE